MSVKCITKKWWGEPLRRRVTRLAHGDLVCSDALTLLRELPKGCADIVFLDPPFNLGKKYGNKDRRSDSVDGQDYFHYISSVISRGATILKDGGSLYLYHIPRWAVEFAPVLERQLKFFHWIAISMKNGFVRGERLYPAHYALLHYTKGRPTAFSRPKIPIKQCRHCSKPIKDYGGYKSFVENGVNLSDFWEDVSPVRHKKYKNRDSNELPRDIPVRVVQMSGVPGGLFVDPFAGSGTNLVVAQEMGMRFVGGDTEKQYCDLIKQRLQTSMRVLCKEQGVSHGKS